MKNTYTRIKRVGVRRALVRKVLTLALSIRAYIYRILLSDNKPVLRKTKLLQATQFSGKGRIQVDQAQLGVWASPGLVNQSGYIEARGENAEVKIGQKTVLNNSFVIIADRGCIHIGSNCLIGPNFYVSDSDFHGLEVEDRQNGNYKCEPVTVKDDVFIGEGVRILKGVTVGTGSVIGSGSLVVSDIEDYCVYAGVPARKIKSLAGKKA